MNVEPIIIKELGSNYKQITTILEDGYESYIKFVELEISKFDVIVKGYEVIASVDALSNGNIIKAYKEYPIEYRSKIVCEHCNKNRYRKYAVIVKNIETNEYKMVGKSCLKDFFGGSINDSDLYYISNYFANIEDEFEYNSGQCRSYTEYFSIVNYLSWVNACIKYYGFYKNKEHADQYETETTASESYNAMFPVITKYYKEPNFKPNEEDINLVTKVITWAKNLDEENKTLNDYLYNINLLTKEEKMEYKNIALAASILPTYFKTMERIEKQQKQEKEKEKQTSNYVGNIGDKITNVDVTYIKGFSFDSMYGTQYIHKFKDEIGNIFIWKSNNSLFDVKEDERVKISGRIKEHSIYRDEKQTVLTRCKVI